MARSAARNRVRIVGGTWRSRLISFPSAKDLRPTPDRVRETLFNWLGQWLDGQSCLDLFAGSGALGFEAASRGAARVVMVENDRTAFESLQATRQTIGASAVEIVFGDALDYLAREAGRFDVVFLDPPFRQNALPAAQERLAKRLNEGARVYIEAAEPLEARAGWNELKRARAGQVSYQLFEWRGDDQGGLPGNV
ncbi:MAG TPA: 16S rRNA (guanine(966)-N(2))-methyltransferase RsmD [Burkholderiales bacterium]|nr:16S rRNA (guanine(966)-N(2))-methyltransferase RsmD [Burkholderiales bacterium]